MRIALLLAVLAAVIVQPCNAAVPTTTPKPSKTADTIEDRYHEAYRYCLNHVANRPETRMVLNEVQNREAFDMNGFDTVKDCAEQYLRK